MERISRGNKSKREREYLILEVVLAVTVAAVVVVREVNRQCLKRELVQTEITYIVSNSSRRALITIAVTADRENIVI